LRLGWIRWRWIEERQNLVGLTSALIAHEAGDLGSSEKGPSIFQFSHRFAEETTLASANINFNLVGLGSFHDSSNT
jgi:hypothetical protein